MTRQVYLNKSCLKTSNDAANGITSFIKESVVGVITGKPPMEVLISNFGTGGRLTTAFTNNDLGYDLVLIPSDRLIVGVGESLDQANPEQGDVALARYLAD
jgi:hypothetical protein